MSRLYSAGFGVLRAYCRQCGIKNWFTEASCARECYILPTVVLITILTASNASVERLKMPVGLGLGALVVIVVVYVDPRPRRL